MKKLQWSTIQKKVDDLIPQEVNPRTISKKQMQDLTTSLEKYNLVEIPAIDKDGTILAGHQRIKALQVLKRGKEMIDVRIPNRKLTEKEAKQYLISSNAIGGDWDFDLLESDFDFDLLLDSGFDEQELVSFWETDKEIENDNFNVEKELKKIKEPKTKLGDIIHLGKHRIICGDSTDPNNLKKLFGGNKASMIYSDPIYNLSVDYDKGVGGNQDYGGQVNDTRSYDEYHKFITDAVKAGLLVSKKDTHVWYWCDQVYIGLIQDVYRKLGLTNKRVALWLKNGHSPVPTAVMNKVYEPCVYGSRGRPFLNQEMTALNEVMNKEMSTGNELLNQVDNFIADVWTAKRIPSGEYEHATTKPLDLHEKVIKRCTKPGDIILDSFLGSGSTLLAADQLDRIVYGCELEPVFCDLIIKRYEKMTGEKVIIEHHDEKTP